MGKAHPPLCPIVDQEALQLHRLPEADPSTPLLFFTPSRLGQALRVRRSQQRVGGGEQGFQRWED